MNEVFSVCLITFNEEGKVLGVTRKDNHNSWALPGGKIEPGETILEAIMREVLEETGLTLYNPSHLITCDCIDKDSVMKPCAIFGGQVSGVMETNEPHLIGWIDKELLFEGAFPQFNLEIFHKLGYLQDHEIIISVEKNRNTDIYLNYLKTINSYLYSALMIPKEKLQ